MTRFYINFRTLTGENPDFIQIDEQSFVKLGAGRVVLATTHGVAISHGRGNMDPARIPGEPDGEAAEWLQFLIVPVLGLLPVDPLAADLVFSAVEMSEEAPSDTERARTIAEQIITGIVVEGFENDADAATVLRGQLIGVASVIERIIAKE